MLALTLLGAVLAAQAPLQSGPPPAVVFPADTRIAVRFPHFLEGGREAVGSVVVIQTTGPLDDGACMVLGPYAPLAGTVTISRPGELFGRGGLLQLRFDSVAVAPDRWVPLHAVLDSLEWVSRGSLRRGGTLGAGGHSVRGLIGTTGIVGVAGALTPVGIVPALAAEGLELVLRGARARILAGQRGTLRLTAPLVVPGTGQCAPALAGGPAILPDVPAIPPRTTDRQGKASRDPINLILVGTQAAVDSAFRSADWSAAERSTLGSIARETEAIVLSSRDSTAPMSHLYYLGRMEDIRFERASPSARARHHVRLWQVDSTGAMWAAAATEDIGVLVSPRQRSVTHRVAPDVDQERELLVGDLLAGGCASLMGYVTLPGADSAGTTVAGQPFVTDARVALVDVAACGSRSARAGGAEARQPPP
jgi:LssY C-terminus